MPLDDQLRRTFESLAERVREETERQLASLTAELGDRIETERAAAAAQAASEARKASEQEAVVQLNAIVAQTEMRGRRAAETARSEGRQEGRDEGLALGRTQGLEEGLERGRREGIEQGHLEGLEQGRREGREEGRAAGWEAGLQEGKQQGRDEGRQEGRADGMEQGRQEGREQGRQEGREQGRTEGVEQGRQEGRTAGFEEGNREGRAAGREAGFEEGREVGVEEGRRLGREEGFNEGREEGWRAGREAGREEGRVEGLAEGAAHGTATANEAALDDFRTVELAAYERLIDAVRTIDHARSLSEVLDALASSAGREAQRVAVLLLRNGHLRGWRFIGFGQPLDEQHDVELASDEAGAVAEAARTGAAVSADSAATLSAPSFAELPPGRELLAVPVQMSGQVVAVLYADQGAAHQAANLAWPTTIELMARHAARCLEAITAFRAAQVLSERPELPAATDRHSDGAAAQADSGEQAEAARRYARLLVSEIKLYHESAVFAGRRERDLATRLGGEIARARVLYEQRVPHGARGGVDYFHEELVKTLADGDGSLLTSQE